MRAIIVDDEPIMLKSFMRNSAGIADLDVIGQFQSPQEAIDFAKKSPFELALLDVCMPQMSGIDLAVELRKIYPDLLVVFISAYDEYIRESNRIGADYYIVKPYKKDTIEQMVKKMQLLVKRLQKNVYLRMFGRFTVLKNGTPVPLSGKAKEILALVSCRRGKEISNEEIYSTIWEGREYSNESMKVYYNALRRLKLALSEQGLENLLLSTTHGQMLNTEICDCDYFAWQDKNPDDRVRFEGEFLSEYSWGEYILGGLINIDYE